MEYRRINTEDYREIMNRYHAGSLTSKIVSSYGYSAEELDSFFYERKYTTYHHESLSRISDLLAEVRKNGRKVFVYGDYDCDGICATAILVRCLNKLSIPNGFYIPNRFTEGYGLNLERVSQAREKGYDVLITVDNGVSAHEALKWAKDNGMTVVVTDHHLISEEVECDILCHPSLFDRDYSYMCGAGVTYLLADYMGLMDDGIRVMAMLATIGDVMELKGFNVQLVREGLRVVNERKYRNIEALGYDFSYPVDENDISFRIVPRINAVGRMADIANPNNVVRFLLSDNDREIMTLAQQINEVNKVRQNLSRQQYDMVRNECDETESFLVLYHEGLHEGLTGLIASRICDELKKPIIIFTDSEGVLKGSGRSLPQLNIMELLEGFAPYTLKIGGHSQACGITIEKERFHDLKVYLNANYRGKTEESVKEYVELDPSDLTRENLVELFSHKPFGQSRAMPLISRSINGNAAFTYQKNNRNYLKWNVPPLSVLSFSNNLGYDHYMGKDVTVIGRLRENNFNGNTYYNIMCDEIIEKN